MSGRPIALFGGSFDPPHYGHVLAAAWARWHGGAEEVWVLPVARHPYGKPLSPWERRWTLCRLAFAGMPFVQLRDDERYSSGYTIDLVERLRRRHPGGRWLLVGGSDTIRDLPRWHRGAELQQLIEVLPVPRAGFAVHPAALPAISSREIRARLRRGEDVRGLLPEPVRQAIGAQGWYGPDDVAAPP
ncbi:MAG: nicotinate-nicotinamide nucleotide adenylyltransferase [Planctomycetota bacterium]|nr:nicotinate-nicotinamide nucleotide adenylyltransferase [Planctomycetota bacterium]MCX8040119.1 nicotinate-nicotinamide nucleotide adenylyltransferase [Planctomycetota bacterium]MDW8373423.1 nicotinate-nicotinamide nucleotide adenylyltransferase [Planctomycetota bacterium]